jgi:hypothetical protein
MQTGHEQAGLLSCTPAENNDIRHVERLQYRQPSSNKNAIIKERLPDVFSMHKLRGMANALTFGHCGRNQRLQHALQGGPRGEILPAPVEPTVATIRIAVDWNVAGLRVRAVQTTKRPSIDYEGHTDTRTQRDQQQALRVPARANPLFCDGGNHGVVVDGHGYAQAALQAAGKPKS